MPGLRRRLPPLSALLAFEAAARHLSITRASAELGVTQAAVSRQIHLLEERLGFTLFQRLHRKIDLTEKGRELAQAASAAFGQLAATVDDLCDRQSGNELVISATVAFSHFWLLPRISLFSQDHPDIKLRIVAQDDQRDMFRNDVDVVIRYGNGMWPDGKATFLFHDEIFPVCSPDFARTHPAIGDLPGLTRERLILHSTHDPIWTGWAAWLASFGAELPARGPRLECSSYLDSIYAAMNGQGIALGWGRLISDLLAQGRLVRTGTQVTRTSDGYFVATPHRGTRRATAEPFIAWLRDMIAAPT